MIDLTLREQFAVKRILNEALRSSLMGFVQKSFQTVAPGSELLVNWHIEAICYALERVARGETKRLLILLPPRSLKSVCASVAFPAWVLGRDPTRKIIAVSYSSDLSSKHARDCRAVMMSSWFQDAFPACRLDRAKQAELEFMTSQRGFRLATSTGGVLTGRGGDLIIIDDPIKAADAQSEVRRGEVQQWLSNTLLSRLDNKVEGAVVVIMQRLHVDDLAGYLMEQGGWEVLSLPAIAECDVSVAIGPGRSYTRRSGEVLHAQREPLEVLERLRIEMGSYDFSAQYQQAPVPIGGNMIKWDWFAPYDAMPPRGDGSIIVQSWDTASSTNELASYSVGITAQVDRSGDIWILDLVRGRWPFPDLLRQIRKAIDRHRPKVILIEDMASGMSLVQTLKREGDAVIAVKPKGDKVMRMHAHTAAIEAGRVHVPSRASWLDEFGFEIRAFPHGRHDDQVDALSQLMTWAEERRVPKASIRELRW